MCVESQLDVKSGTNFKLYSWYHHSCDRSYELNVASQTRWQIFKHIIVFLLCKDTEPGVPACYSEHVEAPLQMQREASLTLLSMENLRWICCDRLRLRFSLRMHEKKKTHTQKHAVTDTDECLMGQRSPADRRSPRDGYTYLNGLAGGARYHRDNKKILLKKTTQGELLRDDTQIKAPTVWQRNKQWGTFYYGAKLSSLPQQPEELVSWLCYYSLVEPPWVACWMKKLYTQLRLFKASASRFPNVRQADAPPSNYSGDGCVCVCDGLLLCVTTSEV